MLNDGDKGVIIQRDRASYAIAPHVPCGIISSEQLRNIADVADKYNASSLKITSASRIAIIGVAEEDVDKIWAELGMDAGAVVGLCVRSVKACPGTTFCKRGKQDSLAVAMQLDEKYHSVELPGKLKIGVSGCSNQCAETCIKDIGLVGMASGWKLLVGGNGGAKPRLALELAKELTAEEALEMIEKIVTFYKANAKPHRRIGAMIENIGLDEFRSAIL